MSKCVNPFTIDKFSDELQVILLCFLRVKDIQNCSQTSTGYKTQITDLIPKVAAARKVPLECSTISPIQNLYLHEWYSEHGQAVNTGSIHSVVVEDGWAFSFGANGNGQLGHNSTQSLGIPRQIKSVSRVAMVSCGDCHTILLCWDSSLYSFGKGKYGALGHGNDFDMNLLYPKRISYFDELPGFAAPRMIATGQDHTLVVADALYGFGWNDFYQLANEYGGNTDWKFSPELISTRRFLDVDGGFGHTIGLDKEGVWACGLNTHGQLGNGTRVGSQDFVRVHLPSTSSSWKSTFVRWHGSPSIKIQKVASGCYHNLLLTVDGKVFSFGNGTQGKLGLGDSEDRLVPCQVGSFLDRIIKIKSGMAHSLCIDAAYRLYAFGMGRRGQLGIEEKAFAFFPKVVRPHVREAAGGGYHSLFYTIDGAVESIEACGRATRGQLGISEDFQQEEDRSTPVRIERFCKLASRF